MVSVGEVNIPKGPPEVGRPAKLTAKLVPFSPADVATMLPTTSPYLPTGMSAWYAAPIGLSLLNVASPRAPVTT